MFKNPSDNIRWPPGWSGNNVGLGCGRMFPKSPLLINVYSLLISQPAICQREIGTRVYWSEYHEHCNSSQWEGFNAIPFLTIGVNGKGLGPLKLHTMNEWWGLGSLGFSTIKLNRKAWFFEFLYKGLSGKWFDWRHEANPCILQPHVGTVALNAFCPPISFPEKFSVIHITTEDT